MSKSNIVLRNLYLENMPKPLGRSHLDQPHKDSVEERGIALESNFVSGGPSVLERVEFLKTQATHAKAQKEGHDAGYQAGHAEGAQVGYQDGLREGHERAQQELNAALEKIKHQQKITQEEALLKFEQLNHAFLGLRDQLFVIIEDDLLALTFETLSRILGKTAVTKDVLRQQIQHTLSEWQGRSALEIHVHPNDMRWLNEDTGFAGQLKMQGYSQLSWIGNPEVELGGCLLRSSEGGLDARIEVQLRQLRRTVLRARSERRTDDSENL